MIKDPVKRKEYQREWVRKNRTRHNQTNREWRKKNPDKHLLQLRRQHLKQHYGMSLDEYDSLWRAQGGACAICKQPSDKNLCVDHDHQNGRVRGLLCYRCNIGVGFYESLDQEAIKKYLG